jgi:hypothetical protein
VLIASICKILSKMADQQQTGNENIAPEQIENESQTVTTEKSQKEIEMEQEAQLRSKYPSMKGPGTSALLQKRLSQKKTFFDSGDYAMAKAKGSAGAGAAGPSSAAACKQPSPTGIVPPEVNPTGEAIPTPETVPHRKVANRLSKLVSMS